MAVQMSAKITDKGVKPALQRAAKAISAEQVTRTAARAMVTEFLPDVFYSNMYRWKPPLRGGMPLLNTGAHIVSAFSFAVSGTIATIKNTFGYAHIHDKGAVIKAKNAKALRFKIGEQWVTKKQVVIPQRRFMYWSEMAKKFVIGRVNSMISAAMKKGAK